MENDLFFIIALLTGIVQIIIVICFFVTVGNVSKIRRGIIKTHLEKLNDYKRQKAFGHTEKARESLEEYVWTRITFYNQEYLEPERSKSLEELRKSTEPKLIEVGSHWPE